MLKLLVEFLIGWPWCWHKWRIINSFKVRPSNFPDREMTVATVYHLQCDKCGDVKKRFFEND